MADSFKGRIVLFFDSMASGFRPRRGQSPRYQRRITSADFSNSRQRHPPAGVTIGTGLQSGSRSGCKAIERADTVNASEKHMPSSAPWFFSVGNMASTIFTEPQA